MRELFSEYGLSDRRGHLDGIAARSARADPNGPAYRGISSSVNGQDLRNAKHAEAVAVLSAQKGDLDLQLLFVTPDQDSDDDSTVFLSTEEGST